MKKKFKVGDRVTGNKYATEKYLITKTGWIGTVTRITNSGIVVQGDDDDSSSLFPGMSVDPFYFELYVEFPEDIAPITVYLGLI